MANTERSSNHTAEPQWVSGGPGKSAYTDYRWECGCGHRYGNATVQDGDVSAQHAAHLARQA
ncbi:MAG: hypothetical protein AB7I38_18855 [Dehalococcoidia bacterium]